MNKLTSLLIRYGILNLEEVQKIVEHQVIYGGDITTNILELGFLDEESLAFFLGRLYNLPWVTKREVENIPNELLELIPVEILLEKEFFPFGKESELLKIGVYKQPNIKKLTEFSFLIGIEFLLHITTEFTFRWFFKRYFNIPMEERFLNIEKKLDLLKREELKNKVMSLVGEWSPPKVVIPSPLSDNLFSPQLEYKEQSNFQNIYEFEREDARRTVELSLKDLYAQIAFSKFDTTREISFKFEEVVQRLKECKDKEELFDYLILFLNSVFEFAALFTIKNDNLILRRSIGKGLNIRLGRENKDFFPLDRVPLIKWIIESKKEYIGGIGYKEEGEQFLRFLHRDPPANAAFIPVVLKDKVVLLIYGDRGRIPIVPEDIRFILKLIPYVRHTLVELIMKKRSAEGKIEGTSKKEEMVFELDKEIERSIVEEIGQSLNEEVSNIKEKELVSSEVQLKTEHGNEGVVIEDNKKKDLFYEEIKVEESWESEKGRNDNFLEDKYSIVEDGEGELEGERQISSSDSEELLPPIAQKNVIIDLGPQLNETIIKYLKSPSEEVSEKLLSFGEAVIPVLLQYFPGPLNFDRHSQPLPLPRVGLHGPLLSLLLKFNRMLIPYLIPLLNSPDSEIRFYATFMFSELIYPEAIIPLSERLFDQDFQIRLLAVDILKRFKNFSDYQKIIQQLQEIAINRNASLARRLMSIGALGEFREKITVPTLIELLEDEKEEIVKKGVNSLIVITKQNFGTNRKKWIKWWENNKDKDRVWWLIESITHPEQRIRASTIEELRRIVKGKITIPNYSEMSKKELNELQKRLKEWYLYEYKSEQ